MHTTERSTGRTSERTVRRTRRSRASGAASPAQRLLRRAQQCRARDLEQLSMLGELAGGIGALVHTLQQERGASAIYLGCGGGSFGEYRLSRIAESRALEIGVRDQLARLDEPAGRVSAGTRLYLHAARALQALDALPGIRERVAALTATPRETVDTLSTVIGCLQAAGFETADLAADPATSRVIVALASFAQGKEYAGQERATAAAAFARGRFAADELRRLQYLTAAQERAFGIFAEFAAPAHIRLSPDPGGSDATAELQRMRSAALAAAAAAAGRVDVSVDHWYAVTTRRIDAMKKIEEAMTEDLGRLCAQRLTEARGQLELHTSQLRRARTPRDLSDTAADTGMIGVSDAPGAAVPVAMLIAHGDPATGGPEPDVGIGLYALDRAVFWPMRSVLDVFAAQARRLDDVSRQLDAARAALAERKLIERAKGLLMKSRRLSESDAYRLMRETAMRQNRRVVEIAEAIVNRAPVNADPPRTGPARR